MKITMYELLGLVKDGKEPKKIKYKDYIYEKSKYNATPRGYYYRINGGIKLWFLDEINDLNDEVEIIEEEKKIPEKLRDINSDFYVNDCYYEKLSKEEIALDLVSLKKWVNDIIDYLDYLKSKGE